MPHRRFGIFALFALLWPVATLALAPPVDLVPNGDFEAGMTGWSGTPNAVVLDATQGKDGAASLKLSVQPKSSSGVGGPKIPAAGGDYLFSLWYRSEGMSRTGNFDGVSASYSLAWFDANDKQLGSQGAGLSYSAQPKWTRAMRLVSAPAGAVYARFTLGIGASETGLPSTLWLDRIQLFRLDGAVKPGGRTWTFNIGDGTFARASFRRVADDDAATGFAVIANTRFITKPDYLAGGMYFKGLPPGQYTACYRMKLAALPEQNTPVAELDANPQHGGTINARTLMSSEFAKAGVYQEIPLRFVVSPETGYVDFRARWNAGVTAWIDTITIREEEIYNAADTKLLFD